MKIIINIEKLEVKKVIIDINDDHEDDDGGDDENPCLYIAPKIDIRIISHDHAPYLHTSKQSVATMVNSEWSCSMHKIYFFLESS